MKFSSVLLFCAGLVSVTAQATGDANARNGDASNAVGQVRQASGSNAASASNDRNNTAKEEKAVEGEAGKAAEGEGEKAAEGEANNAEADKNNANKGQLEEGNANNAANGTGKENQNNGNNNNDNNNKHGAGVDLGAGLSQEDLARLLAGNNQLGGIDLNNRDSILAGIGRLMNSLCVGQLFNVNRNALFALNGNQQLQLLFQLQQIQQLQQLGFVNGAQVQQLFNVGFNNNNIFALGGFGSFGGVGAFNFAGFKRAVAAQMKNLKRTQLRRDVNGKRQQCNQAQRQQQQKQKQRA